MYGYRCTLVLVSKGTGHMSNKSWGMEAHLIGVKIKEYYSPIRSIQLQAKINYKQKGLESL